MEMTQSQKLITSLLIELHQHLKVDSEYDVTFIEKMISNDQLWAITIKYSSLVDENVMTTTPDDVEETFQILQMWRVLNASFKKLIKEEQTCVINALSTNALPEFEGFDGNNDKHYSNAKTIIHDLNRFDEFKNIDLNSHSSVSLPSYRRMKSIFDRAERDVKGDVSKEMLIEIFKAE